MVDSDHDCFFLILPCLLVTLRLEALLYLFSASISEFSATGSIYHKTHPLLPIKIVPAYSSTKKPHWQSNQTFMVFWFKGSPI